MLRRTASLTAEGATSAQIRTRLAKGHLYAVRRGVYADDPLPAPRTVERHRQLIEATMPLLLEESVVSHASAAVLHGLPVWRERLERVTVTRPGVPGNRSRHVHLHRAELPDTDVTTVAGFRVTTMARTVLDLARLVRFEEAVALADAALAKEVPRALLQERAAELVRVRGARLLRSAIEFANPLAASAGESFSRVVLHRLELPAPELQVRILHSRTGVFLGRPDFVWHAERVIGEFDGAVKYTGELGDQTRAIREEKERENALRGDGWGVARWGWGDLYHPERILERWQAQRRQPSGA
ncbi:hypothetical protein CGZ93_03290 [Enemella dayhoffiae]|uniref:Transcriptional regulator, AbiEi antitoxin, Type IV TA system n=1 Tax=Enemella dayhoffiae TaxID=2016507 RepID=A0A255H9G2_9ACTN|nr:hypothetical protein [Enemella dayhoffiae]OYO24430.1 hypothetical protein CGZ93_03290 [Enemella dayhoffiae]